jgi:mono/diheme cytochrome c family protein
LAGFFATKRLAARSQPGSFHLSDRFQMRVFSKIILLLTLLATPAFCDDQTSSAARGKYLAILGDCAGCHTAPHQPAFSGGLPFTAAFGTLYSTNITPDRQTGIGNWTADQFYRALHKGIAADGRHLYPAFPYIYFAKVTRADTDALFAYLKTLPPVHKQPTPNRLLFPFNIRLMMVFWNWLYLDAKPFTADPAKAALVNRGDYLVNALGHCAACHTPKNLLFGDEKNKPLAGGVVDNWFAANLSGDAGEGLGHWTLDDLSRYFATGRNAYTTAAGSMQEKVTLSTSRMTADDRAAIAAYLKSLPPVPVGALLGRIAAPDAAAIQRGEAIFVARCSACHAPPGQKPAAGPAGTPADYPQLAGDTLVVGRDPTTVLRIILGGAQSPVTENERTTYSMPGFAALSDEAVADVATYIRNTWGNHAPSASKADVTRLRRAMAQTPDSTPGGTR